KGGFEVGETGGFEITRETVDFAPSVERPEGLLWPMPEEDDGLPGGLARLIVGSMPKAGLPRATDENERQSELCRRPNQPQLVLPEFDASHAQGVLVGHSEFVQDHSLRSVSFPGLHVHPIRDDWHRIHSLSKFRKFCPQEIAFNGRIRQEEVATVHDRSE